MRIHSVEVHNYRGIESLSWSPADGLVCLLGPGDVGKTTVLDAIEWCLWPRWTRRVSDADFHDLDVDEPVRVEVTVADPPESLLTRSGFDTHQRFIDAAGDVHDEPPDDDAAPALTIRLTIDSDLDPQWHVVRGAQHEPKQIGPKQRAALGAVRLGRTPDYDLRWGKGSALTRLTEDTTDTTAALASAYRAARTHLTAEDLEGLNDAVDIAKDAAPKYGSGLPHDTLEAALDPEALTPQTSALALHADGVPLTNFGLGTRRLLSLALQGRAVDGGAIVLIDEVEHGLEPHRLRHLLGILSNTVDSNDDHAPGQVIMTTHSPTALVELDVHQLGVVRAPDDAEGPHNVRSLGGDVQGLVRSQPEVLLARTVVVGEGATEYGLLRGLDRVWSDQGDGEPLAHRGVALADGGGHRAAGLARGLQEAGYRVALLCDSDAPINPTVEELEALGVTVFQWADGMNLEGRLAADVPMPTLLSLLHRITDERGRGQVEGDISSVMGPSFEHRPEQLEDWPAAAGEEAFRVAAGTAMADGGWIKRIDHGQMTGQLICPALEGVADSELATTLHALRDWTA